MKQDHPPECKWHKDWHACDCELVEIYPPFAENETPSFIRPFLTSLKAIKMALKDVERDGINTWFWENGTFSWNNKEYFWDWKPNKENEE